VGVSGVPPHLVKKKQEKHWGSKQSTKRKGFKTKENAGVFEQKKVVEDVHAFAGCTAPGGNWEPELQGKGFCEESPKENPLCPWSRKSVGKNKATHGRVLIRKSNSAWSTMRPQKMSG